MNSQESQRVVFASLNGYLLRICIKPSFNDSFSYSIDLEQFAYDSKVKSFNIHFRDIASRKIKLKYDQTRANFFTLNDRLGRQNSNDQSLILVGEFYEKQKISRSFIVIGFNETSMNCTIENEMSEKISNSIAFLEEKNSNLLLENIQIVANIPSKTFLVCNLESVSNSLYLRVNQTKNSSNDWEKLFLFKFQYESYQSMTWIEICNNYNGLEDVLSQKFIFVIKICNKSQEFKQIKSFIFDCFNRSIKEVDCEKFFGDFFNRPLTKSNLFEENAKMNYSSLNQLFFNTSLILPSSSNEKLLNLISISVLEYSLRFCNEILELNGACILFFADSTQFYLFFLKNGNLLTKITSNTFFNQLKIIHKPLSNENSDDSKYLLFKTETESKYELYTLNSNQTKNVIKLLCEISEIFVGYDLFLSEKSTPYFLVIKNWINNSFEMIENFSSKKYSENFDISEQETSAMELGDDFGSMNISLTDQQSLISKENLSAKHASTKKDFQEELFKFLEVKKHTCELLLNEALVETKFKYSLITEITNEYSQENKIKKFSLPKTIELYTNKIGLRGEDLLRLKGEKTQKKSESYFKLESTWSTWIDQHFMLNFVFSNKSNKAFKDINSILLLKNQFGKFVNFEYHLKLLRMDHELFIMLNEEDPKKLEDWQFKLVNDFVHNTPSESCETTLDANCLFLITIEIKSSEHKSVLSQFQNGILETYLHLSTLSFIDNEKEQILIELFKQEIPNKIDFFQNFHDNNRFTMKFLYSLLNQRKNSTRAWVTLKIIKIDFEKIGEILQKNLNFEKSFKNETSLMCFMKNQSILTDTICIVISNKTEMNSKLTILCKNVSQLNSFICIFNHAIKEDNLNQYLVLDNEWPIDKLLDSLLDETQTLIEEPTHYQAKKEAKTDDLIINSILV